LYAGVASSMVAAGNAPIATDAPVAAPEATVDLIDRLVATTGDKLAAPSAPEPPSATPPSGLGEGSSARPPVVVMGPSGVGKGTLVQRLMAEHGDKFAFTVRPLTTRPHMSTLSEQLHPLHVIDADERNHRKRQDYTSGDKSHCRQHTAALLRAVSASLTAIAEQACTDIGTCARAGQPHDKEAPQWRGGWHRVPFHNSG
jgi:hypothetical protein